MSSSGLRINSNNNSLQNITTLKVPIINTFTELNKLTKIPGTIYYVNSDSKFYFRTISEWINYSVPQLTTKGDLLAYDTADTRLPVGTDNQVLIADSSEATGVKWADAPPATTPLTTKGDLLAYDTADTRLPVGTDNQVLIADSSEATGVKWTDLIVGTKFGDNVITVGSSGCDFTSPSAALASITDSSPSNRYLILLTPGTYAGFNISGISGSYIEVRGVSRENCIISGSGASLVTLGGLCTLSNMTIETTGTNAIANTGPGQIQHATLRDLTVKVTNNSPTLGLWILGQCTIERCSVFITVQHYESTTIGLALWMSGSGSTTEKSVVRDSDFTIIVTDQGSASGSGTPSANVRTLLIEDYGYPLVIERCSFHIEGTDFSGYDANIYYKAATIGNELRDITFRDSTFTSSSNAFYSGIDNGTFGVTYINCSSNKAMINPTNSLRGIAFDS